jgi:hypothetical protein
MGDMLFLGPGQSSLKRAQGVYVSDDEITRVVDHWKAQGQPEYQDIKLVARPNGGGGGGSGGFSGGGGSFDSGGDGDDEKLYVDATLAVLENDKPSASFIQRQLRVGYNKASRLIEMMEERGVVSSSKGSNKRDVLVELDQWKIAQGLTATAPEGPVGSGLDDETIDDLLPRLAALETPDFPAVGTPPEDARGAHWVKPDLVVGVRFLGFTPDAHLRHPVFRGLRHDIAPDACRAMTPEELVQSSEASPAEIRVDAERASRPMSTR